MSSAGCRSCKRLMEEKHPCRTSCVLSDTWIRDLSWGLKFNSNILFRNYFFLKNYITSEGAVSHNVLYYQQLSIAQYQVSFYANNYQSLSCVFGFSDPPWCIGSSKKTSAVEVCTWRIFNCNYFIVCLCVEFTRWTAVLYWCGPERRTKMQESIR